MDLMSDVHQSPGFLFEHPGRLRRVPFMEMRKRNLILYLFSSLKWNIWVKERETTFVEHNWKNSSFSFWSVCLLIH